jgi:hypothetical protein
VDVLRLVDFSGWLTWASLAIGLSVGWLVYRVSGYVMPARRRNRLLLAEDDVPWESLLELLKERHREREAEGYVDDLPPDELFRLLMSRVPPTAKLGTDPGEISAEDVRYLKTGRERRGSRRRWANPIEVRLTSPFHEKPLTGLVINRSAGGLAIVADADFKPGSALFVRAVEAPASVPSVEIIVRHSRRVARLWLVGCQYKTEVPWNVKVWFG